jgi:hypothetical protein
MQLTVTTPKKEGADDALNYLFDAWNLAIENGVAPSMLAYSALYVALTDLVAAYGETAVADLAEGLSDRILKGEFTLYSSMN